MQKASQTPHQKASLEGKKRQSSHRSCSRVYQGQSSISEEAQPRIRIPYKREHKFKYLIYSALLFLNFCSLFVLPVSTFATSKPSDANGKNVVKEEKTCPSGQYLNPETKRCKKFPPQKMKTCPEGYFLNVKTNRCNKNPVPKKSTQSNPKPKEPTNPSSNRPDSKDQNNQAKKPAKDCLPGYFLNKITGRCNKQHEQTEKTCPEGTFRNKITGRCNKIQAESQKKPCHADQYRNPKTGRCHKMATSTAPKTCPAGKVLNPVTNRCKGEEKPHEIKACKEGYERNDQTHRCRKVHQNTGASNPVEVPKLGDKKEEQKKDFNGTTAVAGSAAVGLGIAIFQFKNEIFVIIRKIFLHK